MPTQNVAKVLPQSPVAPEGISMALAQGTDVVLLDEPTTFLDLAGAILAERTARQVLTTDMLRTVFDLEAQVVTDPVAGTPMVVPVGTAPPALPTRS